MATRCNIIVEDKYKKIQIYRHYDGYPEVVIPDLNQVLQYAWGLPRFEADEFAAAIVRAWKDEGGGNIRIDGNPKRFELIHGDVEWVYVVKFDQKLNEPVVEVYDWREYWLDKADVDSKSFKPKVRKTVRFSEIARLNLAA